MSSRCASGDAHPGVELKKRPLSSSSGTSTPRKKSGEDGGETPSRHGDPSDCFPEIDNTQRRCSSDLLAMEEEGTVDAAAVGHDNGGNSVEIRRVSASDSEGTPADFSTVIAFDKNDFDDILRSLTPEREVPRRRSASARLHRLASDDVEEDDLNEARRRRYLSHDGALNRPALRVTDIPVVAEPEQASTSVNGGVGSRNEATYRSNGECSSRENDAVYRGK